MKLNEIAPTINSFDVTYQSNYNGVSISVNGKDMDYGDNSAIDHVTDKMVDWATPHCDDEGYFEGDIDQLKMAFTAIIHEAFGSNCTVTVREDNISS